MTQPIALCLQYLEDDASGPRFLRCFALPGGQPGLGLTDQGEVRWLRRLSEGSGLWVTQRDELVLFRAKAAGQVTLHRDERSLEVPLDHAIELLDQDVLVFGAVGVRLHVHGESERVSEPTWLVLGEDGLLQEPPLAAEPERPSRRRAQQLLAATVAVGSALGIGAGVAGCTARTGASSEGGGAAGKLKPDMRAPTKARPVKEAMRRSTPPKALDAAVPRPPATPMDTGMKAPKVKKGSVDPMAAMRKKRKQSRKRKNPMRPMRAIDLPLFD